MDIDLARTFLEVADTGHFAVAANHLNVTQSAVSMRVKSLEEQLGCRLFSRTKAGTTLTPAGRQFRQYAATLVRVWEQARQHVAIPPNHSDLLSIGGQFSLWDLLLPWLPWMRSAAPDVALKAKLGLSETLMRDVVDGLVDIAVVYTPAGRPGLQIDMLMEEELVLVTTHKSDQDEPGQDYVHVDWGQEFQAGHNVSFPDLTSPGVCVGPGPLGLNYILENGGSGYFRKRVIRSHVENGRLRPVETAPTFRRPVYAVYSSSPSTKKLIEVALRGLHHVASTEINDDRAAT